MPPTEASAFNQNREVDPDGSIALKTYVRAYAQPAAEARKAIKAYYADAHAENSSYPFVQGLEHIAQKYKRPDSQLLRYLSQTGSRQQSIISSKFEINFISSINQSLHFMYYRQERALLTGARVTLLDPYALASVGGIQTAQASHEYAKGRSFPD